MTQQLLVQPTVLRNYALIADGERGGLIGPDGAIIWLCAPRWDSPAVLNGLLGGRGQYAVTPVDQWHVWGGYYEPGSLIWRSRWVGRSRTECREALQMPADPHRVVIMRRVEAVDGPARVRVVLGLRAQYGRQPMRELSRSGGHWTGRSGGIRFRWSGARHAKLTDDGHQLTMTLSLAAGERHDLVLELSDRRLPEQPVDPQASWDATANAWNDAVPSCDDLIAVRDARHAYAVLRGLTASSGGMVAAATTSLPERLEAGRNYDYRYAWIRDQCYAGLAVAAHGPHPLLDGSVRFVTERVLADGSVLQPAYCTTGGKIAAERTLQLPGYPGGTAIAGNHVRGQFQLDTFGESLQLLAAAGRHGQLDADNWRAAELLAAAIEQRWHEPDAGIWELENQAWTHSRLACVAGLRAIAEAAGGPVGGHGNRRAAAWTGLADKVLASLGDAVHRFGHWQRSAADGRVDAALLLPALRGAVPATDPRSQATFAAVRDQLSDDGFVYRYRHDDRPLHLSEGAFLLCGFWLALAAHQRGETVAAQRWFERSRAACGPPGLYTEEYDVHQQQLRGNLPQAFVHAGMLECAVKLSDGNQPDSLAAG